MSELPSTGPSLHAMSLAIFVTKGKSHWPGLGYADPAAKPGRKSDPCEKKEKWKLRDENMNAADSKSGGAKSFIF